MVSKILYPICNVGMTAYNLNLDVPIKTYFQATIALTH